MTLAEFEKELAKRGFHLTEESKKYRAYSNGNPYPSISVHIEKDGIHVRRSGSFNRHERYWLEDIRKDGNRLYGPSFNEKSKMCGHKCKDPMIHQCEWCLDYKEVRE